MAQVQAEPDLPDLRLPPGFHIAIYADNIPNARSMTLGDEGTLFVGTRTAGKLYALQDKNGDHRVDVIHVLAENLDMPNGVVFRQGSLYVAESGRLIRFDHVESRLGRRIDPQVVTTYEAYRHHGWRYLGLGPDDKLYLSYGAPCNVCDRPGYGNLLRLNLDGSGREIVANGVRNSVGFDWHPESNELWFTDNGRDSLGDDVPPDELNRVTLSGEHFGFPYCHGGDVSDPDYGDQRACDAFTPPVQKLGSHVASLGMRFYTGKQFPKQYHQQVFIAEHGSWNRSEKVGYRISLVRLKNNKAISYEPFIEGWLSHEDGLFGVKEKVSGRPVDLLILPDGSLLISDDKRGVIYRVWYDRE